MHKSPLDLGSVETFRRRNRTLTQSILPALLRMFLFLIMAIVLADFAVPLRASMPTPRTNADGQILPPIVHTSSPPVLSNPVARPSAPDFAERNNQQRWVLLGVMAGLLIIAGWYGISTKQKVRK